MLKSNSLLVVFVGALLLGQISAAGDEPTKPSPKLPPTQDFAKMMKDSQEAMIPYKAKAMEAMLRAQLNVLSDPDSAAAMTKYVHNLYEGLLKGGFSREQALEIVIKLPLPSISVTTY